MRWRMHAAVPLQIDPALRLFLEFLQNRTVDCVDHHALPAIGDADDPFTGHRLAA